ncbi:MAG TPA: caspase family protein [Verrucomicrobiae bacterium]
MLCFLFFNGLMQGAEMVSTKSEQSAGLFVGVGKFGFQAGLENLEYAPDDAVALAYRLVVELKMVPPAKAQVVLAGEPKSVRGRKQLAELKATKLEVVEGTRNGLQKALRKFSNQAEAGGLALMSFSGHGYETQKDVYLMPSDGNWQLVRTTGVSCESVWDAMRASKARTKVLLLDACRQVPDMASLEREAADKGIRERVQGIEGLTILASCSAGQRSWQAKSLEQGVFTHLVLERLKGEGIWWVTLGDQVVKANVEWFEKREMKGPVAWCHESRRTK